MESSRTKVLVILNMSEEKFVMVMIIACTIVPAMIKQPNEL